MSSLSQLQDTEGAPSLCDAQVRPGAVCLLFVKSGAERRNRETWSPREQVCNGQMAGAADVYLKPHIHHSSHGVSKESLGFRRQTL